MDSRSAVFRPGDKVLLSGWGVGEKHWGGLAELARVNAAWLLPLPSGFTARQSMILGTAGYTAMLCVMALERAGVLPLGKPVDGPVLVTGASGGVGSIAVMLLSTLGHEVVAVTGRESEQSYLESLGASRIISRTLFEKKSRPLEKAEWVAAIDVVGGQVLASVCAAICHRGAVAACGLAGGMDLPLTVAPFILRGVSLLGVDSAMCPKADRVEAWNRLAQLIDVTRLESVVSEYPLSEAINAAHALMDGKMHGRILLRRAA